MKIKSIHAENVQPVDMFSVDNLSDLVVIAGPNGVGKTRLISEFIKFFGGQENEQIKFEISATSSEEEEVWGRQKMLNTENLPDRHYLREILQKNRMRRNFRSSVLYYESSRTIRNIKPLQFQWEMEDPWEEHVSWNIGFGYLSDRFEDTLHAIFKKIQTQKTSIANRAIALKQEGRTSMNLEFEDSLNPFKEVFLNLLGPKELDKADLQANTLRFRDNDDEYDINALSSGEREVLTIAFDFLLRRPSDCIIFFDEPELHLHPELLLRLINTLRNIGKNNQFILCSHSPDIISSSLEDTVIFLTPKKEGENQAVLVRKDDESAEALNRLGHSIGIVSLGKKIVLIEGTGSSLDKRTYSDLLNNRFPGLILLPCGGKDNLSAFDQVVESVLNRSLWGIDFYMLADRDSVVDGTKFQRKAPDRFKVLSKYHLENYFLDSEVLAAIFRDVDPEHSWLCDPEIIESKLGEIAKKHLPYATTLIVANEQRQLAGNIDVMIGKCQGKSKDQLIQLICKKGNLESGRINKLLDKDALGDRLSAVYDELEQSISDGSGGWKLNIPGKAILETFCNKASIRPRHLKSLYIRQAEKMENNPFDEIIQIFKDFSEHGA